MKRNLKNSYESNQYWFFDLRKLQTPLAIVAGIVAVGMVLYASGVRFAEDPSPNSLAARLKLPDQGVNFETSPPTGGLPEGEAKDSQPNSEKVAGVQGERYPTISVSIEDDPVLGNIEKAQYVIVEMVDFECPYCRSFYESIYPKIVTSFVDSGRAAFIYKDLPLDFHPRAIPAANAANCVREQVGDKGYFEYVDSLMGDDISQYDNDDFVAASNSDEINSALLKSCVETGKFNEEVLSDMNELIEIGVNATPTFVVGRLSLDGKSVTGYKIVGPYDTPTFELLFKMLDGKE